METIQILFKNIFLMIFALFKNQSDLAIENLALRQQLSIYHHSKKRSKIRLRDRLFWILISRFWKNWKESLIFVKPETVIGWHRNPMDKMGLQDLCLARLDFLETKSKQYYQDNHRLFQKILDRWGDIPVTNIQKSMVHQYLLDEALRFEKEGKDNYSVNADLRYLRAMFNYAIDDLEVMEINPARKIKFYGIDEKLKYIPPEKHIDMVYCYCLPHQRRLLTFCKETACRVSEALRATDDDIDKKMNLLTLWTRKKRHGNLSPRRIELPEAIKDFQNGESRIFPEWEEKPRFLEKACKAHEMRVFGWHSFRHRKASLMAMEGIPLIYISQFLGHESLEITQRYLRILGFNGY